MKQHLCMPAGWADAIDEYVTVQRSGGAPETTLSTRRQHLQHLGRRIGCGPWQVTADALVAWAGEQTWSTETRRGRRSTFRSFYGWAIVAGKLEVNPAIALPRVKPKRGRARPSPATVYEEAVRRSDERTRLILRLAHDAGLRRREIAVVHSLDVIEDLDGWSLLVHGKGDKDRMVPLTRRLAFELRALPAGWVFPGDDDGHLSPRWVGKLATRVLPDEWTLHTLRHSFGTRTYRVSDVFVTQELLGHASPATTRVYVELPRDALRRAVDAAAG